MDYVILVMTVGNLLGFLLGAGIGLIIVGILIYILS